MKEDINIEDFSNLSGAASFYLTESFHYVDMEMESLLANKLFSLALDKIDPSEEDRIIMSNSNIPDEPIELLRFNVAQMSDQTMSKIEQAWQWAQKIAAGNSYSFDVKIKCAGVDMLGVINNLNFLLEVLTYRHLLFLYQTKTLDQYTYTKFEQASPIITLLYIFKEQIGSGGLEIDKIQFLQKLRNKAVHYTPNNARGFNIQLSELILIWKQLICVFELFEKSEKFEEHSYSTQLKEYIDVFKRRWLKGTPVFPKIDAMRQ